MFQREKELFSLATEFTADLTITAIPDLGFLNIHRIRIPDMVDWLNTKRANNKVKVAMKI